MAALPAQRCALITTGGTIVSRIDPATGLAMPVLSGQDLLQAVGEEAGDVEVHDFCRVASPHIGPEQWAGLAPLAQSLLDREDIAGVVVSHGTATLEETAWFLDLTVRSDKPLVVTGAQRNASARDFDGPRNLLTALRICRAPAARGHGVLVALNEHINAAREATKSHTVDVETFQSGEWGYLGSVVNERVTFHRSPLRRLHLPLQSPDLPRVDIVPMYAGADGALVRAAVAAGARGVVIESVASGHVNGAMHEAVVDAMKQGVAVVVSTRIPRGGTRVGYGFAGSSALMVKDGAVLSGDLSPWKARIVLMLALQQDGLRGDALARLFER
jgi:L-asparaginase